MNENKKSKIWMIIALIAIVIIVILGVMLLNNNKKESAEVGKTEKSAAGFSIKG